MSKLHPDRWPTVADVTARCDEIVEQGCPTCHQDIPRSRALIMAMDGARAIIRRLDRGAAEGTLVACTGHCRRWVSMATVTQVGDRPVCPTCADEDLP
jgi:hypothetical protein